MGPGFTRIFLSFGKSSQNSPKPPLICWSSIPYMCILSVYTLLRVVRYYDLSVLSMSVMGFQKKSLDGGLVGWVSFYPSFFWIFGIFLPLQSP